MIEDSVVIDIRKGNNGIMMKISTLVGWTIFWMMIAVVAAYAFMYGWARQTQIDEAIRAQRCMQYGEHLPKAMENYCKDLGV